MPEARGVARFDILQLWVLVCYAVLLESEVQKCKDEGIDGGK